MTKHVCIRTKDHRGGGEMYVANKMQPEGGGGPKYGTYFDDLEDAKKLRDAMAAHWPSETFEVFTLVKR